MEHVAGADLHKRVIQLTLLREGQDPSQYRISNDPPTVEAVLRRLPPRTKIAVEATGAWWWFVEQARDLGHEVFLSHPKQTKAIAAARLKSDRVDALMLARLLKADLLPTVWIPREPERHTRELLAHRARLGRARTAVINELHALYAKRNLALRGMVWLRAQPAPVHLPDLTGYAPRIVEEDVALLRLLNAQMRGVDQELRALADADPQAKRLMTIPGVGPTTAVAVSCWVGEIRRFVTAKKLASYFGLAPRVRQSAERARRGRISKEGSRMVRWLLVQAALSGIRLAHGPSRRQYRAVLQRRGRDIARVAAARRLVGVMFHLLKDEITYAEFVQRGRGAQ
jgi:transposase